MLREDYELHCWADRHFFDTPERIHDADCEFPLTSAPLPAGWRKQRSGVWIACRTGRELPEQGWKVHVSATADEAAHVIDVVAHECFARNLDFKFLRSAEAHLIVNSKGAPRGSSGKLVAIYPRDEHELTAVVETLEARLAGVRGPYILGDLRIGAGPLYVRYGGFTRMSCPGSEGQPVPAIRRPDGTLVPDVRGPVFAPPEWVAIPAVLAPHLAAYRSGGEGTMPYTITAAIAFSNSGGIYRATDPATGSPVIVREARPHAGWDRAGNDAVARLDTARRMLARLDGLSCVPRIVDHFVAWEHHFLVEEFIEGKTLLVEILERHPAAQPSTTPEALHDYCTWLDRTLAAVQAAVEAVHARGVVWGDVHPANVIVRPDGSVVLIDFEAAGLVDDQHRSPLVAAGFAAPGELTGPACDLYAVDRTAIMGLLPHALNIVTLSPRKAPALIARGLAYARPPASLRVRIERTVATRAAGPDPGEELLDDPDLDWPRVRSELAAGILATATPERHDRLYPGDPQSFATAGVSLAHGAAGVLFAVDQAGLTVPGEHVDWLVRAAAAAPRHGGLLNGPHGVAVVLHLLGRPDAAAAVLARADEREVDSAGLASGLSGIGLTHLHLGRLTGEDAHVRRAAALAERLAGQLREGGIPLEDAGLFEGMSGVALFLTLAHEATGERGLLAAARTAIDADLARCVEHVTGASYVQRGTKSVPYLADGSAGVALALHRLLHHVDDGRLAARLRRLLHGLHGDQVVDGGLALGRAGLLAVLHAAGAPAEVVDKHRRELSQHALTHQGRIVFSGRLSRRLSTDLATGSAGVLAALTTLVDAAAVVIPGLPPAPATHRVREPQPYAPAIVG